MSDRKTLAIVGLDPKKLPWGTDETSPQCKELLNALTRATKEFYKQNFRRFSTTLSLGAGIWFAEEVMFLPEPHQFYCYIPYRGQESQWSQEDQERYRNLLAEADRTFVCGTGYSQDINLKNNKKMVDGCDMLIAVWDSETIDDVYSTIRYARTNNKPILQLNPKDYWGM